MKAIPAVYNKLYLIKDESGEIVMIMMRVHDHKENTDRWNLFEMGGIIPIDIDGFRNLLMKRHEIKTPTDN